MRKTLLPLTETAIMIALATVLELICKQFRFLAMPNGGSITIAILPIMFVGFRNGLKYGILAGICYAIINFIFDGLIWHWGSIFFDYLFAFGVMGITGLFKKARKNIIIFILGIFCACSLRYLMHGFSGVLFFGEYAAEYGYADAVWFYSFIFYNLGYNLATTIACILVGVILWPLFIKKINE